MPLRTSSIHRPNIGWQLVAYTLLTASEVLVSITGLEFSYTQAPTSMKAAVMSLYLLSVAAGNLFTVFVNMAITKADGTTWLSDVGYYTFFVVMMSAVALAFVPFAMCYRERSFVQGADQGSSAESAHESAL